ncbi:MAG: hypothetical protein P4M12_01620 [Gammaproteobacteria bacterium]|nr:hypothetical protein [Gammaproteobacteria bacterium]
MHARKATLNKKRSAEESAMPTRSADLEKIPKTNIKVSSSIETLRKINHPDILLFFIEESEATAAHRRSNISMRIDIKKDSLLKLSQAGNCVYIRDELTPYKNECAEYRNKHKENVSLLLKKLADRYFEGDTESLLEVIPTASRSESNSIIKNLNTKFNSQLTLMNHSINYLENIAQTIPSTASSSSGPLSKQYANLRRLSNLPQIGFAFLLESKSQATNLRINLNKRLSLIELGIHLIQKDNCVFIEGLKSKKQSHDKSILIFQKAIIKRMNTIHQSNELSIAGFNQTVKEATPEEAMTIQACYDLLYQQAAAASSSSTPIVNKPAVIATTITAENNSSALIPTIEIATAKNVENNEDESMPQTTQPFSIPLSISTSAVFNDLILEPQDSMMPQIHPANCNLCWANMFSRKTAPALTAEEIEWVNSLIVNSP